MVRWKKAIAPLAISLCSLLAPSAANARDPCYHEGTCEEQQPQTPPPQQDPGTPPPTTPPPVSGIQTSLLGAFNMNDAYSNHQIYTVGWSSAPNGYHPILANDTSQDGVVRWGGYNKLMTLEGPTPLGEAKIAFVKSKQGLGEHFVFSGNTLRIVLELMDWYENSWYRVLKDTNGNPGLLWARLDLPSGTDAIEHGLLDYYRCDVPRTGPGDGQLFEQHETYAMNRLYGPYDITTPEGLDRARADVTFMRNRDNPLGVPDAWRTFPAQLGHPNAHAMLYVMRDMWGPRDSRPIYDETHWGNMEMYAYIEVVEPDNSWRRGVGLIGWGALDEPDHDYSGTFLMYRQQIQTTIVQDVRTRMLQKCEVPTSGSPRPMTMGSAALNNWYRGETFLIPEGIDMPRMPDAPWKRRPKWVLP